MSAPMVLIAFFVEAFASFLFVSRRYLQKTHKNYLLVCFLYTKNIKYFDFTSLLRPYSQIFGDIMSIE